MNLSKINKLAWEIMGHRQANPAREPGYIYYHGQRVARIAIQLRELIFPHQNQSDQIIQVGSWFHDVGKGIEPHWEHGAILAEQILDNHCSKPDLEKIKEIIGKHTLRKEQSYPFYVRLVQDADVLDHFGSQEIWLNFLFAAYMRENLDYSLDFYDRDFAKRIRQSRQLLNFEESIWFFNEKEKFVQDFVERLRREGAGELLKIEKTKG